MIARISGRLEQVGDGSVVIDTGDGFWYELLVPAYDVDRLRRRVGQEVALHTIHYLDGDPSRGNQTPRLVGFAAQDDRRFFRVFTTVKGIGVRKALKVLVRPIPEIAAAIAAKDVDYLSGLPEIGKRTAERIIAELHEKVGEFAGELRPPADMQEMSEAAAEALAVLVQLGERRPDAAALVARVMASAPQLDAPQAIIQQVYRLKAGGI